MPIIQSLDLCIQAQQECCAQSRTPPAHVQARTQYLRSARRVSESAAGAIQHVHESRWYKILLPLVAPLADPAVKRIMNSPAFQVLFALQRHTCLGSASTR